MFSLHMHHLNFHGLQPSYTIHTADIRRIAVFCGNAPLRVRLWEHESCCKSYIMREIFLKIAFIISELLPTLIGYLSLNRTVYASITKVKNPIA